MNTFLKRLLILLSILGLALILYCVFVENIFAERKSPKDIAKITLNELNLKVEYGRPSKRERDVFGALVPFDKVWRTGANEAAEITLYKDMKLGDGTVKAGTYSLFTIPGDDHWVVILSSDINVWGSYTYNEANDVTRIKVPVSEGKESIEAFSIVFEESKDGAHMHLGWGTLRIAVPFVE